MGNIYYTMHTITHNTSFFFEFKNTLCETRIRVICVQHVYIYLKKLNLFFIYLCFKVMLTGVLRTIISKSYKINLTPLW